MPSVTALAVAEQYSGFTPRDPQELATDLESFSELLTKWNRTQNLVSRETGTELWTRHMADSLQVLRWLRPADRVLVDLGSGGGFPALPLAIALKGHGAKVILVESQGKKAAFLRAAIRELQLDASVSSVRAETLRLPNEVDVITARAVTNLADLLRISAGIFGHGTRALFHKGREAGEEINAAAALWSFQVLQHRSDTDPGGVLLEISGLQKRP